MSTQSKQVKSLQIRRRDLKIGFSLQTVWYLRLILLNNVRGGSGKNSKFLSSPPVLTLRVTKSLNELEFISVSGPLTVSFLCFQRKTNRYKFSNQMSPYMYFSVITRNRSAKHQKRGKIATLANNLAVILSLHLRLPNSQKTFSVKVYRL